MIWVAGVGVDAFAVQVVWYGANRLGRLLGSRWCRSRDELSNSQQPSRKFSGRAYDPCSARRAVAVCTLAIPGCQLFDARPLVSGR